tara:strand:- start:205 stop:408 length:204 start_codon:yes stop_codon:yes gene_type:complete
MMRELNIFFVFIFMISCMPACSSLWQEPKEEPEFEYWERLKIEPIEIDYECDWLPENDEYEECVMVA